MIRCPCCNHQFKCSVSEFFTVEVKCNNCMEDILVTYVGGIYRTVNKCREHKLTLMLNKKINEYTLICSECYHVEYGKFDQLIITGENEEIK